ncbi:MAG: transposase [Chloroflexota bacterium]
MDIIALLQSIDKSLEARTMRQLRVIVTAMLSMTGRVTMLGVSRWAGKGGSYRTIQRFYNESINWSKINWLLIRHYLWNDDDTLLIAGDETVVTKAGQETYGLDRFFSSLFGKPVPGLAFFAVSLISVKRRSSSVVVMEQLTKEQSTSGQAKSKDVKATQTKVPRKRGRPKGSKNKNRRDVELPPYLQHIQTLLTRLLALVGSQANLVYCVLDGAFGHNNGLQMVRRCGLHLICKLRSNSALYQPYQGPQKKRGAPRKYGQRLDYDHLPTEACVDTCIKDQIRTDIYHLQLWHKRFPDLLNVVIIVKVNLSTNKRAHVILFSSDLSLSWSNLVDYYRLRFQIEFNFRDAKQFWGLEDFMNVKQLPVHNAANLAMFMVNVSQALILSQTLSIPDFSVNDLKAHFRGQRYLQELLKFLPLTLDPFFIRHLSANIGFLGAIRNPYP